MSRLSRRWKLILPLGVLAIAASVAVSTSLAASGAAGEIRVAIMTDCKGAFGFGYEIDIGGAQAAFAQYAGGKVKNPKKPSAGMTGIKAGGKDVRIVGYGCGDDTVPTAVKETRRLMEQLRADVMIGPLSGDEAVYVARYAKSHPTKTFIIGTAGSQDPTLQLAQPNVFRYHGDGAQWNAGTGEIAYKRLGGATRRSSWTTTASAGRPPRPHRRLLRDRRQDHEAGLPAAEHDRLLVVRPATARPRLGGRVLLGRRRDRHAASLKAFEQTYGALKPSQHIGNLFFAFLGADKVVAPKVVGSYVGGFGTGPGLKTRSAKAYEAVVAKHYPGLNGGNYADGFVYNYYNAAWALVQGLTKSGGQLGSRSSRHCRARSSRATRSPTTVSSGSTATGRRSRISTRCRSSRTGTRSGRPSSATCRTSTSPSAASSRRRARRLAARSLRA